MTDLGASVSQAVAVLARKQEATPMAVNHSPLGYQPTTQIQAHKPKAVGIRQQAIGTRP